MNKRVQKELDNIKDKIDQLKIEEENLETILIPFLKEVVLEEECRVSLIESGTKKPWFSIEIVSLEDLKNILEYNPITIKENIREYGSQKIDCLNIHLTIDPENYSDSQKANIKFVYYHNDTMHWIKIPEHLLNKEFNVSTGHVRECQWDKVVYSYSFKKEDLSLKQLEYYGGPGQSSYTYICKDKNDIEELLIFLKQDKLKKDINENS